jgi:NAD(P)-dependent dehydrogenase (short-subunit alcohol dehydrogenase family)
MVLFLLVSGALIWIAAIVFILAESIRGLQGRRVESVHEEWMVVTGCDSGFGLDLVAQLSTTGASVIACTYTEKGRERALKAGAKRAHCFDLANETALADVTTDILQTSAGKVRGVVHNAGIVLPGFAEYQPLGNYHKVMAVNFFAIVSLTQKLIPAIKAGQGRIVLLSSVDGIVSLPGNAPYDASKFAVEAYADALRVELSFWNISVSVINPSTMRTPMAKGFFPDHRLTWDQMNEQNPDGEWKNGWSSQWLDAYISENQARIDTIAQDPKHAVNDIMHALTSSKPKFRYLSGILAKTVFFALWVMPERWSFVLKKATVKPPPNVD